jgi:hypothetical protein
MLGMKIASPGPSSATCACRSAAANFGNFAAALKSTRLIAWPAGVKSSGPI